MENTQIYMATLFHTNKTQLLIQSLEKQSVHLVQLTLGMS